jgi:hypothetical protein
MTSLKRSADSNNEDDIDAALLSKRGNHVILDIMNWVGFKNNSLTFETLNNP